MRAIQEGYLLQSLSDFSGSVAPQTPDDIDWKVYDPDDLYTIECFKYANFMLSYTLPYEGDAEMLANAAKIGVVAGQDWDANLSNMTRKEKDEIKAGIAEAVVELNKQQDVVTDGSKLFNTREVLGEDYLDRAFGVLVGRFGNYATQAIYNGYFTDSDGNNLDGSKANYTVTFPPGGEPECGFFWSFTMYSYPDRFLVSNVIARYSIGSQSKSMKYEEDGSLILYFQYEFPGSDKIENWLPAPEDRFYTILRVYGPTKAESEGLYQWPELVVTSSE